jgi:hypothetical protein
VTQRSLDRVQEALLPPATEAPQDAAAISRALAAIRSAKGFDAQRLAFEEGRACPGAEVLLQYCMRACIRCSIICRRTRLF